MATSRKLRTVSRLAILGGVSALILGLGLASPVHASQFEDSENQGSPEACRSPGSSKFKFTLYYNSNFAGAYRNIGYAVGNFADVRIGGAPQAGLQPLHYCSTGNGSGQSIKNNAASAENRHSTYIGWVYYNSWFQGASDAVGFGRNLNNTYNNNASFQWKS